MTNRIAATLFPIVFCVLCAGAAEVADQSKAVVLGIACGTSRHTLVLNMHNQSGSPISFPGDDLPWNDSAFSFRLKLRTLQADQPLETVRSVGHTFGTTTIAANATVTGMFDLQRRFPMLADVLTRDVVLVRWEQAYSEHYHFDAVLPKGHIELARERCKFVSD